MVEHHAPALVYFVWVIGIMLFADKRKAINIEDGRPLRGRIILVVGLVIGFLLTWWILVHYQEMPSSNAFRWTFVWMAVMIAIMAGWEIVRATGMSELRRTVGLPAKRPQKKSKKKDAEQSQ